MSVSNAPGAIVLSCPLQKDEHVHLRTQQDYSGVTQFLERAIGGRVHQDSQHRAQLTKHECLRSLAMFFAMGHNLNIVVFQGEGCRGTGDWVFCDGKVSLCDVLERWRSRTELGFDRGALFVLLDCCYSGCWPSACAAMRINGVYIQAACSPAKQTADSYEDSFSQAWLKVQMNRSLDALEQFPLVQFRNPHFYRPQCSSALNLGALEVIFFLSEAVANDDDINAIETQLAPLVPKLDGAAFLGKGSRLLSLHVDIMDCMSGFACSTFSSKQLESN